ncbi:MAG: glycosyltransferase family 4 protein [Acidimicrobiia bacterium]|nr:glycosyltransferase family 4 protein [Acidimicrobiia bacterium]
MRVALVCPYAFEAHGGVQDQVTRLVGWLGAAGHDAWAVAPGDAGPPGTRSVGAWRSVRANRSAAPIAVDPRVIRRVADAVAGADVVHVHEPFMPMVSLGAILADTPPIVGTFHADPGSFARNAYRIAEPLVRRVAARIAVATAVSEVAASAVPTVPGIRIIPNGIDLADYADTHAPVPGRVVFIGRDDPRKGLDVLLQAWPRILRDVPGASLRIIGADRPSGPAGVTFLGRVDEPTKRLELGKASVVAAPNIGGESFGIVVLEAMAAGKPIVAADLDAFRGVAGDTVRWVPVGDPVGLGRGVAELLGDADARAHLGAAARERAAMFSGETVARAYLIAYGDAISGRA